MQTSNEEKRRFNRIFHDADVTISTPDNINLHGNIHDISLKGCLVKLPEPPSWLNKGDANQLAISLTEEYTINVDAEIAFHDGEGNIGYKFLNIDIDSITFLRRLVELNLGDTDLLERDLKALASVD